MQNLTFHQTHTYAFPVTTAASPSNPAYAANVALTVTKLGGDIALAFLGQTGGADEVVYLKPCCDVEFTRHPTPPGMNQISGMGYNPVTERIWTAAFTPPENWTVAAFDPDTGQQTASLDLSASGGQSSARAFATNGFVFVRGAYETLELFGMGGAKLGERTYPGYQINGITASPGTWTFVDWRENKIVVINAFGDIIATAPGVGTPEGMSAIAFDTLSIPEQMQQLFDGNDCSPGDVGTLYHHDTPWVPQPWQLRHRLYIANVIDQTIYAGYLT